MSKLRKYIRREIVQAVPAFNISGEIIQEDNPAAPTVTNPSQEGYGIYRILDRNIGWEQKETFEELYVPFDTRKEMLECLRSDLMGEIYDLTRELESSTDEVDNALMRIEKEALTTCYRVIDERISRMK